MIAFCFVLIGLQTPPPSMEDLIRGLSHDSVEAREKAQAAIRIRWKSWAEGDLVKLRKGSENRDRESAIRARTVLTFIELLRDVTDETWRALPDFDELLLSSEADRLEEYVMSAMQWWPEILSTRAVVPVLLLLLEDRKKTTVADDFSETGVHTLGSLARSYLSDVIPVLTEATPADACRRWWFENRRKSEEEWLLPGLSDAQEKVRAGSIVRLVDPKKPELDGRLFAVLEGLRAEDPFCRAVAALADLPEERRRKPLSRHLGDRRPLARFEVARILLDSMRRESLDSVIEALVHPERMSYDVAYSYSQREILKWLHESGDPAAMDALHRLVTAGADPVKTEAIRLLVQSPDPRIEKTLMNALQVAKSVVPRPYANSEGILHPRLCDIAGLHLSRFMKAEHDFEWPLSGSDRNRNLEEIWQRWRKWKGSEADAFAGPNGVPLPPEKVVPWVRDLASESEERRSAALRELSKLGPAAWPAYHRAREAADPVSKARMREAEQGWTNALRSVRELNKAADALSGSLRKDLHRPFVIGRFFESVLLRWFEDEKGWALKLEISRGAHGHGIAISIGILEGPIRTDAEREFAVINALPPTGLRQDRDVFLAEVKAEFEGLRLAMEDGPDALMTLHLLLAKQDAGAKFLSDMDLEARVSSADGR